MDEGPRVFSISDIQSSPDERSSVCQSKLLESVKADIDKEDVHDRKKWRKNVMKGKSNHIGKRTINR